MPLCAVDTQDGSGMEPELDGSFSFDRDGRSWESFDGFTASASGEYTVDCDGDTIMIGEASGRFSVWRVGATAQPTILRLQTSVMNAT